MKEVFENTTERDNVFKQDVESLSLKELKEVIEAKGIYNPIYINFALEEWFKRTSNITERN